MTAIDLIVWTAAGLVWGVLIGALAQNLLAQRRWRRRNRWSDR